MQVVHGTWIPDPPRDYVQSGSFYLWVETDSPPAARRRSGDVAHPRHLARAALAAFLTEKLGLRDPSGGDVSRHMETKRFLLPSAGGAPLPSFELLRYVDEETPEQYDLASWEICCYRVPQVITTLNDIHFVALNTAEEFQLGTDLLFWYQYAQVLKGIIARDQYIPALKYRALASGGGKRARRDDAFELYPGWELLSDSYEAAIRRYADAMPMVCAAGGHGPDAVELFAPEPLLRHFSEYLLYNIVAGTPFPAVFDQRIAGTLLYACVHPHASAYMPQVAGPTLDDYKQWQAWRARLTRSQTASGFTLCFQLDEAPSSDVDDWQMHFLVAAKRDPSLKMRLAEYWSLTRAAKDAVQQRYGPDFEKHVLLDLGYAARIYPKVWDGLDTALPAGFRLTLDEAFEFLKESAWVLEDAGYAVIVPAWWTPEGRRRARIRLKTSLRPAKGTSAAPAGYFSRDALIAYQYELSIDGQPITEAEWQALVNAKTPLVQFRGQWMELDREKMQQLLAFWQTREHDEPEMSLLDMIKVASEAEDDLEWDHDQALSNMLSLLHDKSALAPAGDPPGLRGTLRDYQKRGVAWLQYLESLGLSPCLADDMGLGKTVQVIACLVNEAGTQDGQAPTLLIAPTSVLGNWRKELERFAPQLRTLLHQGSARSKDEQAFKAACREHDVVVTSFALARLDEKLLRGMTWRRVVVDEAQNIKNPQAAQTRAITKLSAPRRLALTGTPVENRLRDLWSIFNFLNPGYLGREAQFRKTFETPIQKGNDLARSATLKRLVEPFILRRLKTDKRIIDDLPDKIEQRMYCNLTPEQASLYEAVVRDVDAQLEEAEGIGRKGLILATLLRLKQICNHPAQFLQDGSAFTSERSHKLKRLAEMTEEAIESGQSLLIFTQFTEIGAALERYMASTQHYNTYYLHGGTSSSRRDRMIAEFQDPESEPSVFILSLRAGGVGITLTKANHVFHFDRWWNPAVEDQATDRAFRIGQRKNVFVHKFVAIGTMEERIDAMIEDKKRISSAIVGADESWLTELDNETFKDLIALRRSAVLE